jgi:hypothetical protein
MSKSVLNRYAPFLALAGLQLLLVTMTPAPAPTGTASSMTGAGGVVTETGVALDDVAAGAGDNAAVGAADGAAVGGSAPVGAGGGGGAVPAGASAGAGPGGGGAATQRAAAAPAGGDKSKCAPGGLLQENVTLQSPPCMPKFVGEDNGGTTYQGVTKDKIKVVIVYQEYGDGVQQVLAANNLAMTPEKAAEVHGVLQEFFNKHYEFHGRQLQVEYFSSAATDAAGMRADAKAINETMKPFAVLYYAQGLGPVSFHEQLAREKVLNLGVAPVADDFFIRNSPYVWSQVIQGYRMADMAADFYCKRMYGKNATLAGDPAMRIKKRKLGVGSSEAPDSVLVAKRFISQVTGGMCGTPNDGTTLYTYSADPTTAESQRPALVTRMKNDGITTVRGLAPCAEGDNQAYYPEVLAAEVFDDDFVGRVYAAQCGVSQMGNVFGIGMFPKASPATEKEFYKAAQSVRPGYEPPYLTEGPFQGLAFLARLIQYAGPNLTPASVRAGALRTPQIGGWTNPNAWPGWKCCNPYTPMYHVGMSEDSYTAKADARQIYWDNTARSGGDGVNGSWVGVDDSKRYAVGQWTPGEPKQP